ncbi:hypothetical protein [Streptomyces violascens]|uniref:hypothetical protein n=1 Tax=Streptomyces violascens TaxID=67381 RepID=UPI0036601898
MENDRDDVEGIALDDVDALIEQLESEFEDSQLLTMSFAVGTEGCTKVASCTGSCPCGPG